jgi:hypothetical protein
MDAFKILSSAKRFVGESIFVCLVVGICMVCNRLNGGKQYTNKGNREGFNMIIRAKSWRMLSVQEKMFILKAICNKTIYTNRMAVK